MPSIKTYRLDRDLKAEASCESVTLEKQLEAAWKAAVTLHDQFFMDSQRRGTVVPIADEIEHRTALMKLFTSRGILSDTARKIVNQCIIGAQVVLEVA